LFIWEKRWATHAAATWNMSISTAQCCAGIFKNIGTMGAEVNKDRKQCTWLASNAFHGKDTILSHIFF
jgi:hypothetical protein